MKAAVYLRVSTDDQHPENQRDDLLTMATGRGFTVVREYVEEGISGAKGRDQRPALAELLDDAARGKFKAVFVWRIDRLSRDDTYTGGIALIGELDRYGVDLFSHQETYLDTAGPFRRPLLQIALSIAADERMKTGKRTRAGLARARARGARIGRPETAPPHVALQALRMRQAGLSWREAGAALRVPPETLRRVVRALVKRGSETAPPET